MPSIVTRNIWYSLRDESEFVYHYTPAETLVERILPTRRLCFSRFTRVNDPRESKQWSFSFNNYNNTTDETAEEIKEVFNDLLKTRCFVGCFTVDAEGASVTNTTVDPVAALYHRGYSHSRMWAQYAKSYKGACLVFDKERLNNAVNASAKNGAFVRCGKVHYENDAFAARPFAPGNPFMIDLNSVRMNGLVEAARLHLDANYLALYFRKILDWETENEFRWIVSNTGAEELYVDYGNSLVGIMLGEEFPAKLKATVGEFATVQNLSVAAMEWRNNGVPQPQIQHLNLLR